MNAQIIFTLFYGIFFSLVLASSSELRMFQFGYFFWHSAHKTLRLIVSIILLNILPALYFASVYSFLPWPVSVVGPSKMFVQSLSAFLLGLSVFGFYRLYHVFLACESIKNALYNDKEEEPFTEIKRRLEHMGPWYRQLFSVCYFFGLALLGWLLLIKFG